MAVCSVITLLVIAFVTISGILARPDNAQLSEKQIARLREVGAQWKDMINWTKKPYDEFNDFLCTNKQRPKIGNGDVESALKEILMANPEVMTEAEKKYFEFTTTCKESKPEEIYDFIKSFKFDSIGNWPAFEETWDSRNFNLPLAIAEMSSYNFPVIFYHYFSNSNSETTLVIGKDKLTDIEGSKSFFKTKFEKLGVKNAEEVLTDATLFHKTFNEAADSVKSTIDLRMKFSELKAYLPQIDWDMHVEVMFGKKIPADYPIVLKSYQELQNIYTAISKLNPKVIANYLFCALVDSGVTTSVGFRYGRDLFTTVFKGHIIKYLYTENMKQNIKEMSVSILETLEEVYHNMKMKKMSEEIMKFINEDIFRTVNEDDLLKGLEEISTDKNDCVKNYIYLQKLYKRRNVKFFINTRDSMVDKIQDNLVHVLQNKGILSAEPSPLIFESIFLAIAPYIVVYFQNSTVFSNSTKECFSKQFTDEVHETDMKFMLTIQLIPKTYLAWIESNPNVVQQENKILKKYGFSAQQLLLLSFGEYTCDEERSFKLFVSALANSVDVPKIFDSPVGSKLNPINKCKLS